MAKTKDKIQLINHPPGTNAVFLSGGGYFIDLEDDFSFSVTEVAEELNDVNQLGGNAVIGFDVPDTPKNKLAFREYISGNSDKNVYDPIPVRCIGGGSLVLPQELLYFKGYSESSGRISLDLEDADDFWRPQAEQLKLNTLDLGTFTQTKANIKSSWDNIVYNGTDVVVMGLIHYGRWFRSSNFVYGGVSVEDFLPLISVSALLVKGFAAMGWKFDSPLLEDDWFKRLWCYILAKEINYSGKGAEYEMVSSYGSNKTFEYNRSQNKLTYFMHFDNVTKDLNDGVTQVNDRQGSYSYTVSRFLNVSGLTSDFDANIKLLMTNNEASSWYFRIKAIESTNNTELASERVIIPEGGQQEYNLKLRFNLEYGQEVYFTVSEIGVYGRGRVPVLQFDAGTEIQVIPSDNRIYKNDVVSVGELINPDYNFFDFFKGIIHLGGFKIKTDFSQRTVSMYPPRSVEIFGGAEREGYYLDYGLTTSVNLDGFVVNGSKDVIVPNQQEVQNLLLRFKKSDDEYIRNNVYSEEEETPLYSQLVDFGAGEEKKPKELSNPFFEPTANIDFNGINIPAMWDNNEGKRSHEIGPRILYGLGKVEQTGKDASSTVAATWVFDNEPETFLPYFTMLPEAYHLEGGSPIAPKVLSDKSIVYGGQPDGNDSLFTLFYPDIIDDFEQRKILQFLVRGGLRIFEQLSFRKKVTFFYNGDFIAARLIAKRDFKTSQDIPFIIELRPETFPAP